MRKFSIFIIIVLLGLFIGTGCKKNSSIPSPEIEIIDGIEHVHNPAVPQDPELTVSFQEELAIGEEDNAGNIQLYRPGPYTVDKNTGNIFIGDNDDMSIKIFSPVGRFLRTIGRKGAGPGEFERIGDMEILPDGRLLVFDTRLRRGNIFSADGKFETSHKFLVSHFDLYMTTDTTYTTEDIIFGQKAQLFVKTYDLAGKEVLSYGEFTAFQMKVVERGGGFISISLPYEPLSIFAGNPSPQWLFHCLNNQYIIEAYDREGNLFRKFDRPYKLLPFTQEDAEKYYAEFEDEDNPVFAEIAREVDLPSHKTITERMIVDDRENLWVETFEEKREGDHTLRAYDIFSKQGFYIARVWSHLRPGRFLNGKMYHMQTDAETGFRTLKRYQVIWKE